MRINIYRNQSAANSATNNANGGESTTKAPDSAVKVPDNEQKRQIYKYVLEHDFITTAKAAQILKVKERRSRAILSDMVENAYLTKKGAARSTIYVMCKTRKEGNAAMMLKR